jgi:GNAT superfamily N-acetyltransferase
VTTRPARARGVDYVAEVDGRVVGRVEAGMNWIAESDSGVVGLSVLSAFRRRGIGSALWEFAETHMCALGVPRVLAQFHENDDGDRFARRRGFRPVRSETVSAADPRAVAVEVPDDVDLRPVAEFEPAQIQAVDEAATADMPLTEPMTSFALEEWLDHVWRHPLFTKEGSFAAVVDGRPVAISLIVHDGGQRAASMFTGTLREFRGRGLAVAAKTASLRWAAEHGVTQVYTSNDETNAPMLAVNRKLGYRPVGRGVEYMAER